MKLVWKKKGGYNEDSLGSKKSIYSNFEREKLGLLAYKVVDGGQHFVLPGRIEQKRSMVQSLHDSGIDTVMA